MGYKVLKSETKFEGKVFSIRQDEVELPNGRTARLDIVVHGGAVTMIPVDEQNRIWFVRQYRHAAGLTLLELPAGVANDNEQPEIGAMRELQEETGMSAQKLEKLGEFYLAPGYSTEKMHVYLATGLQPAPLQADEDEFLDVVQIPVYRAFEMMYSGEIQDAKSLAALALFRR
jgi:ADP-ribose pyrophosphatase